MSRSDECERCGEIETYRHLFWECKQSRTVWRAFNDYMTNIGHKHRVLGYDEVFTIDDVEVLRSRRGLVYLYLH